MENIVKSILELVEDKKINAKVAASLLNEIKKTLENDSRIYKLDTSYGNNEKIAVIGMAVKFPMADTLEEFWDNLIKGRDCITEVPPDRFPIDKIYSNNRKILGKSYSKWGGFINNVDEFATEFFKLSKDEAKYIDPQQRIFLEIALETFQRAGYSKSKLWNSRTSVIVGARASAYNTSDNINDFKQPKSLTGNITNFIAARISDYFNFKGSSFAIDAACSSSLVAIHYACNMLRLGECDMALAGGIDLKINPLPYLTLSDSNALSMSGKSYTFDKRADGFVPGEGAGAVLLKPLAKALNDGDIIYGVIAGSSVNNDGHTMGITTPNYDAQKEVIKKAYENANINPDTVSLIEAHGTGTTIGDPIEIKALTEIFREYTDRKSFCAIGSVKTNIGHLDTASGIAGFIKVVLSLYYKKIVPTLNCDMPNPRLNFVTSPFYPATRFGEWKAIGSLRRAGISSFGFGGTNCHVVLEEYKEKIENKMEFDNKEHLLVLSAENKNNMKILLKLYENSFNNNINFYDFLHTANTAREKLNYRVAFSVKDIDDALLKLQMMQEDFIDPNKKFKVYVNDTRLFKPAIAMVFPGQGAQYIGMARELYNEVEVFKKSLDECSAIASEFLHKSLIEVIYKKENEELLNQTAFTQPALFSICYSLAQMWIASGVKPRVVFGHSIGEYVAACISGIINLKDALKLVCARGELIQKLHKNGGMIIVFLQYEKVLELLNKLSQDDKEDISIAAINTPFNTVISGKLEAIEKLIIIINNKSIRYRRLNVSHAFHSKLMEPMLEKYDNVLESVTFNKSQIPIILNVTGEYKKKVIPSKSYWKKHINSTVMFEKSVHSALSQGINTFLEVGPSTTVATMLNQIVSDYQNIRIVSTLNRNEDESTALNDALAQLFTLGCNLEFGIFEKNKRHTEIAPICPLKKEHCWVQQYNNSEKNSNQQEKEIIETISSENLILRDHIVNGKNVFPGAALWEIVIRNARKSFDKEYISLENIKLLSQVELKDKYDIDMKVIFNGESNPQFKIFSRNSSNGEWRVNVVGNIKFENNYISGYIDIPMLFKGFNTIKLSKEEIYNKFINKGIIYGPMLRSIEKLWSNENSVISKIELNEIKDKEFLYHPGFVDGALQSIIGLNESEKSKYSAYIPFIVDKIYMSGDMPHVGYSYLKVVKNNNEIITVDIVITDVDGNIKMKIMGNSFKKLNTNKVVKRELNKFLYAPKYVEKQYRVEDKNKNFSLIILSEKCDFKDEIISYLSKYNINVIWCINSDKFNEISNNIFYINIKDKNNIRNLFDELHDRGIGNIKILNVLPRVDCSNLNIDGEDYLKHSKECLIGISKLIQELNKDTSFNTAKLLIVSRCFSDQFNIFETTKSVVCGFIKSAIREFPKLKLSLVDTDNLDKYKFYDDMINELKADSNDIIIKYNSSKRFVETIEEIKLDARVKNYKFKSNETYIITGGLNGIGFSIAKSISEKYSSNLILVGRSKFPTKENWDLYLTNPMADKKIISKIKAIKKMEDNGSTVKIFSVDVCNKIQVEKLYEDLNKNFKINGIFHLAGVIKDALIKNKNVNDIEKVLAPKVLGSINIVNTFKNAKPSFIVFFSSIASFFGSVGQSDYAAANSFMDDYAKYVTEKTGIRCIDINWTLWEGTGMGEYSGQASVQKKIGINPFNVKDGFSALENIIKGDKNRIIAFNNDIRDIYNRDDLQEENENVRVERLEYQEEDIDLNYVIEEKLALKIAGILNVGKNDINSDVNFMELGLDSITIVEFTTWIGEMIKAELYPTLLFEYSTIKDLSEYLVSQYRDSLKTVLKKPEKISIEFKEPSNLGENLNTNNAIESNILENNNLKLYNTYNHKKSDIAIIGFSGMFPEAANVDEYWDNLKKGVNCISHLTYDKFGEGRLDNDICGGFLKDVDYFDPLFFNISPKETAFIDPQQRLFLENAWKALDMAGYSQNRLKDKTVGVYVGASQVEYKNISQRSDFTSPYMGLGNSLCLIANRVSYLLNLKGPSFTVDSACSASLVALYEACNSIMNNEIDMAIAGGTQLYFSTESFKVFKAAGMLSSDGRCKTFDEKADGYVRGEGIGAVILKSLDKALEDRDNIYAVVKGIAVNHDGNDKVGISAPNPNAQREVILKAIEKAGVNPEEISYAEAHGTGTSLGDPVEIRGLTQAYRKYTTKKSFCAIGTAKTSIGHLEAAAGIAGIIKTILMFKNKMIPPTVNFNKRNPSIPFNDTPFYVNDKLRPWKPKSRRYATVSSFGFGGTNCHVILSDYENINNEYEKRNHDSSSIISISAKTLNSLNKIIVDLEKFTIQDSRLRIEDLCFSMNTGRDAYDYRAYIIATSTSELINKLGAISKKGIENSSNIVGVNYKLIDRVTSNRFAVILNKITNVDINILQCLSENDKFSIFENLNKVFKNLCDKNIKDIVLSKNYKSSIRLIIFISGYVIFKTFEMLGIEISKYVVVKSQVLLPAVLTNLINIEQAVDILLNDRTLELDIKSKNIEVIDNDTFVKDQVEKYIKDYKVLSVGYEEEISNSKQILNIESFSLQEALGAAYLLGVDINWVKYYENGKYNRIVIPTYPLEKRKYSIKIKHDEKVLYDNKIHVEDKTSIKEAIGNNMEEQSQNVFNNKKGITWFLKNLLSRLLGINEGELDISLDFSNFGIDSLIIGDAIEALDKYLGASIPHSVFIEYSSIKKLSTYLENTYGNKINSNHKYIEKINLKERRMNILENLSDGLIDRKSALAALLELEGRDKYEKRN